MTSTSWEPSDYCLNAHTATLRDALRRMELIACNTLFVVVDDRLVGSVSMGDVRRALINGLPVSAPIDHVMNSSVASVGSQVTSSEIASVFRSGVNLVPQIDSSGRIMRVLGPSLTGLIPISKPSLTSLEVAAVAECVQSGWISSKGPLVAEFEQKFALKFGLASGIAVSNGTHAIALALHSLGVGPGDEVLVPNLTFGATANAVSQVGATPSFVDVESSSWGIDPTRLDAGRSSRLRAVIAVHLYGKPCRIVELANWARQRGVFLIEDCAEAIGTYVGAKHVGSFGDAACFSFFANKAMTTGEGGFLSLANTELVPRARTIRDHGLRGDGSYCHDSWGSNFRMTGIQCALGLAQLERVDWLIDSVKKLGRQYISRLQDLSCVDVSLHLGGDISTSNYWLMPILLDSLESRIELSEFLGDRGIETRPVFPALSSQRAWGSASDDLSASFPTSMDVSSRGLCLPLFSSLESADIDRICDVVRAWCASRGHSHEGQIS